MAKVVHHKIVSWMTVGPTSKSIKKINKLCTFFTVYVHTHAALPPPPFVIKIIPGLCPTICLVKLSHYMESYLRVLCTQPLQRAHVLCSKRNRHLNNQKTSITTKTIYIITVINETFANFKCSKDLLCCNQTVDYCRLHQFNYLLCCNQSVDYISLKIYCVVISLSDYISLLVKQ